MWCGVDIPAATLARNSEASAAPVNSAPARMASAIIAAPTLSSAAAAGSAAPVCQVLVGIGRKAVLIPGLEEQGVKVRAGAKAERAETRP